MANPLLDAIKQVKPKLQQVGDALSGPFKDAIPLDLLEKLVNKFKQPPPQGDDPLYQTIGEPIEKVADALPKSPLREIARLASQVNPLRTVEGIGPGGLVGGIRAPKYATYHGHAQPRPFTQVDPSRLGAHRGNQFLDNFFHTARSPQLAQLFAKWGKEGRNAGRTGSRTVEVFELPQGEYVDFHNPRYKAYPDDYERLLATFRAKFGKRGERILDETKLGGEFRPNSNTVRSYPTYDGEPPFTPFIDAINEDPQLLTDAGFTGLRYDNRYQLTADPNFMPGLDQVSWAVVPDKVKDLRHVGRYYLDKSGSLQRPLLLSRAILGGKK